MFRPLWYCATCLFTLFGILTVSHVLNLHFGLHMSPHHGPFAAVAIAAVLQGYHYGKSHKSMPSTDTMWVAALSMTAMATLIFEIVFAGLILFTTWSVERVNALNPQNFAFTWLAVVAVSLVIIRFAYQAGLKVELSRQKT